MMASKVGSVAVAPGRAFSTRIRMKKPRRSGAISKGWWGRALPLPANAAILPPLSIILAIIPAPMSVARPVVVVAASTPARCIGWCGSKYGGQAKGECYGYQNRYLHWDFLSMGARDLVGREPNVWASEKFHLRRNLGSEAPRYL
jgi:hypothetical protein